VSVVGTPPRRCCRSVLPFFLNRLGARQVLVCLPVMLVNPRLAWRFWFGFLLAGCGMKNTKTPPGDLERFDPITTFGQVAAYAGTQPELVSLSALHVGSDGLLNLKATYRPQVRYNFIAGASAVDVEDQGNQAPGYAFGLGDRLRIDVGVHDSYHLGGTCSGRSCGGTHRGMGRHVGGKANVPRPKPIPPPTCSFARLWKTALAHGVPANLVANIDYDSDGYDLRVVPEAYWAKFDTSCTLTQLRSPPKSNPSAGSAGPH
jgi:hypothetical protein